MPQTLLLVLFAIRGSKGYTNQGTYWPVWLWIQRREVGQLKLPTGYWVGLEKNISLCFREA